MGEVSAVVTIDAPDGSKFGMLSWAPKGAPESRGKALVTMREIAQSREPELLGQLTTNSGLSAEYAMSAAISHASDKGVKADLVRVAVAQRLEESDRFGAVTLLSYARAAELDLPEHGRPFLTDQYGAAVQEGDAETAWMIAGHVLRERNKILKKTDDAEAEQQFKTEWDAREKQAFGQHAEQVLADEKVKHNDDFNNSDLRMLFDHLRFREDGGFNSENRGDLADRVAEAIIQADLSTPGREFRALIDAADANMSDAYIADLRRRVNPSAIERVRKWLSDLNAKLTKITS